MSLLLVLLFMIAWYCRGDDLDYELVAADIRNIIFVGRSRTGKTTLIEVLKDAEYSPSEMTIIRSTKGASVETFTMESKQYNNNLHFNIMDTPGLFEKTMNIDDKRTNEIILDMIKKCIDMEITKINHVYFVMSISQGLNEKDLEAFRLFTELFIGLESKISIIISFAQTLTTEEYEHYIGQFKTVPALKPLHDKINGRIFFLGAAAKSATYNMEKVKDNVASQRAALFEHIIQQKDPYNVKELKIYKDNLSLIQRVKETLTKCCAQKKCPDLKRFDAFIQHYTSKQTSSNDHDIEKKEL